MDFERWFQRQGDVAAPQSAPVAELPDGLWDNERKPGKLFYTCRGCEQTKEWHGEPEEYGNDSAYCGGAPWCCP